MQETNKLTIKNAISVIKKKIHKPIHTEQCGETNLFPQLATDVAQSFCSIKTRGL